MTNFSGLILFLLLWTAAITKLYASEDEILRFDEKAFLTVDAKNNVDSALNAQIQSFYFRVEENGGNYNLVDNQHPDELRNKLKILASHIQNNSKDSLNLLITGTFDRENLKTYLTTIFGSHIHFFDYKKDIISDGFSEKVTCLFQDDLVSYSDSLAAGQLYNGHFSSDPQGKLIILNASGLNSDSLKTSCIKAWQQTGRIPNFILTDADCGLSREQENIKWLNSLRRFRGEVKFNGQLLDEIYWKQMPGTVSPGQFSFPVTDYSLVLSPYKNGYLITPGEIIHHKAMRDVMRSFLAYHTELKDGLVYHFRLNKYAQNKVEIRDVNTIINDIKWTEDKKRKHVAYFHTSNSFIDYNKPNLLNFNTPISISAWLKPEQLTQYMGIIGIGTSFSIKLNNGYPDFTTAQIKDHIAETLIKKDVWTHLGIVFNPGGTIDFFINGEKTQSMQASEIQESDQSLVIGNNIWGEQFFGYMDELMIWDRGLSEDEFRSLYKEQLNPETNLSKWFLLLIPLFIFFVLYFVFKKAKRRKTKVPQINNQQETAFVSSTRNAENRIEIFGNFNVVLESQENISNQFSPLLKQLLSFLVIKTHFNETVGVSTKEMNDTFWPGFTKEQAKDNRGTNIKKLRKLLDQLPDSQIVFHDKKWFLQTDKKTSVDLDEYKQLKTQLAHNLKNGAPDKNGITRFLQILSRGNILQEMDYEWLDTYKGKITEDVSELLIKLCRLLPDSDALKTEMAKTILLFDDLNEDALIILVQNLSGSGNHGLAKQVFEEFSKRYASLYSEPFTTDFYTLIKGKKN